MSHFCVLVVTHEKPTDDILAKTLAPWHEFECTGRNDEYVIDIDKTDEAREEFATAKETRLRDSAGNLHERFDENGEWKPEFSKPGLGRREEFVPEGFEKMDVPAADFMTFASWAADYYGWKIVADEQSIDRNGEHKYGYILVDDAGEVVRCVDRTNPNAKWDWWTVGGRYSGRLVAGYDPTQDPDNQKFCFLCSGTGIRNDEIARKHRETIPGFTCNGYEGTGREVKFAADWKDIGNSARWGDLDLEKLKASNVSDRRRSVCEMIARSGVSPQEFEIGFQAFRKAHAIWRDLPEPRPRGVDYTHWLTTQENGHLAAAYNAGDVWNSIDCIGDQTISDWVDAAPPLSAYAIVIDGKWHANGEMGWFGVSHNEVNDWPSQMQSLLNQIEANHFVTFIDCHI